MHRRSLAQTSSRTLTFLLLLALFTPAGQLLAQAPPQPLSIAILTATKLTPEQEKTVQEYVDYWSGPFTSAGSTPEDVENARKYLLRPFTDAGVRASADFRHIYSKHLLPKLDEAIKAERLHTAINAIIILSQLGHDRALTALLIQNSKEEQPKWQLRLQSAYGCKTLLESGLVPRKAVDAATDIKNFMRTEDNPLVMRHQFAAIDAANHKSLPPDERKAVRETLIEALASVVDRVEKDNTNPHPSPLLESANSAIPLLRARFLEDLQQQPAEQADLGVKVAPILGRMLSIAAALWDGSQQVPESKQFLSSMIGTAEGFLATIDNKLRSEDQTPKTRLRDAWDDGKKETFTAELNQWLALLKQDPYVR